MATQFDIYQKMLNHQRLQSGLMVGQTALMGHMAGSLNHLQGEMNAIRQMNLEGLAIQQEMLQREQLQSQLEEFIYNTQKMVTEFSDEACDQAPSIRYFGLKGVAETVKQLGVGTALIRGRDNKAAFETAMKDVHRITMSLEKDPDVVEAIAWAKAEEKRLADEQTKRQAEQKRISAEKETRRNELIRRISDLKTNRRALSFTDWYSKKFDAFFSRKPPFDKLPILSGLSPDLHRIVASVVLWVFPGYGFIWIPIMFILAKNKSESDMNSTVDGEISKLERELSAI